MTSEEIQDRFTYHPPSKAGVERHAMLSQHFVTLAEVVEALCPDGREKAVVLTHLETAKMWASAAVARNQDTR